MLRHTLSLTSEKKTFHGSHYSSDHNELFLTCTCGYKSPRIEIYGEFARSKDFFMLLHSVDILLKTANVQVRFSETGMDI